MRPYSGETRGVKPTLAGRIYYGNTYVALTDRDMEARSFSMQTGTSVPGSLSVGAAVMGSVKFTLINRDGKFDNVVWKGSTFSFVITTENGNITNDFKMGTYYIANHTETGDRIQVEAYDAFRLMDETPIYEDIQNYGLFPSGQAAQSMGDAINCIVTAVNARYNVGLTTTGLATPNTALIKPANDQMSERQLISYIAQLCGQYVIIRVNSNGNPILKFGWYDTTSAFNAGTTFSHTLRTNDITVTGVKLSTYSGDNSYELGNTNGSVIVVETNPLITDVALMQMYAQRIYNAVNGLTFRPGSATIRGTPAFEAGDYIKVSTLNEDNVYTIITNLTYTFDLTIDVTADAPPYEGDLALIRSRYIRDAAKQAVSEELNDNTSELSEAIAAAGGGTVVHFPMTNMECYDPTHWFAMEAPCNVNTNGIFTTYYVNGNNVVANRTADGYDFDQVIWMGGDVCIPPYDANSNEYFDVIMYLYLVDAWNTAQNNSVHFLGEDTTNSIYYPLPLHVRAKYAGSATLLQFESQWALMPANYEMGGMMVSGLMVPLPSTQFNMSTGQWVVNPTSPPPRTTYYAPVTYS